jgi:hypothetical protein
MELQQQQSMLGERRQRNTGKHNLKAISEKERQVGEEIFQKSFTCN